MHKLLLRSIASLVICSGSALAQSVVAPADAPGALEGLADALARPPRGLDAVRRWSKIANGAAALDHASPSPEQLGPPRTSRAMAIVHIAIADAVNAVFDRWRSYTGLPPAPRGTSPEAAVAQAARDTLVALYPAQAARFDALLAEDLAAVADPARRARGVAVGQQAAAAILALRAGDGAQVPDPPAELFESAEPGRWRRDPVSQIPIALGAFWGQVKPFAIPSPLAFRVRPPPALTSAEYAAAFAEVKALGGVGDPVTPTARTLEQTLIGIYWGYDAAPFIGAPIQQMNEITLRLADLRGLNDVALARLLGLVHVTMADAAIACWDSKYVYRFWRPVSGIREADLDGNPATAPDPGFVPLGAQATNRPLAPDFTPPFPAYPSGHAVFAGAFFAALRQAFGTDRISFTFVSAELDGTALDFAPPYPPLTPATPGDVGMVRPLVPRSFPSLSAAAEEDGQSRIYLGVHWRFDKTAGLAQGRALASFVAGRVFQPR